MMKKINLLLLLLLWMLSMPVSALTVYLAPPEYYTTARTAETPSPEDIRDRLSSRLKARFPWEAINISTPDIPPPRSFLDALKVCNEHNLDYLLYGFIEEKDFSLYGEIKLFDRLRREVIRVFYSSDNPDRLDRLTDDLSGKIGEYFADIFALPLTSQTEAPLPEAGILSFAPGAGYWTPLGRDWSGYIAPLYALSLQARFTPVRPAAGEGFRGFYFRTGLTLSLYHSVNRPGYEEMDLVTLTLGIPAVLCADIGFRHTITLGVEPQCALDYLVVEKLYTGTVKTPGFLFSTAADMEYQFHYKKNISFGMGNRFVFQFVNPPRVLYHPYLVCEISLTPLTKSGDQQ